MIKFKVSYATAEDANLLVKHRLEMFEDMYPDLTKEIQASRGQTLKWIKEMISNRSLIGFIIRTEEDQAVGSGCLWIRKEQPNPTRLRLQTPYLMSVYTEKSFRRGGVAKLIVKTAIDWCREHNYDRITLHAAEMGRQLYEAFGFKRTNEMKLEL